MQSSLDFNENDIPISPSGISPNVSGVAYSRTSTNGSRTSSKPGSRAGSRTGSISNEGMLSRQDAAVLNMPAVGYSGGVEYNVKRTNMTSSKTTSSSSNNNNASYAYAGFNEGGVTPTTTTTTQQLQQQQQQQHEQKAGLSPATIKLTISNGNAQASMVTTSAGSDVGDGNNMSYSSSASYTSGDGRSHAQMSTSAAHEFSSTSQSAQYSSSYSSSTTYTRVSKFQ